jgi:hypothetical protein
MTAPPPPTANNIRAVAHNALIWALPEYVKFSDRLRVSDAMVAAVEPLIRASERERLYAELGSDHYAIFTEDRFTVEHSVDCRLSGQMPHCAWHAAVVRVADEFVPDMAGRWLISAIDGNGEPVLVRADDKTAPTRGHGDAC